MKDFKVCLLIVIFCLLLAPFRAESQMSSANYKIDWDTVGVGGDDVSSSASYTLRDSIAGLVGLSSSASYELSAGYRAGVLDQVVGFEVFSQDLNTQVAATSLSGNTVNVSTSSGFAVGDMIAVIQNEGASQVSAIGQVLSLTATSLTVDELSDAGSTPVIDGSNDYVYVLSGDSLALANLTTSTVSTGIVGFANTADVAGGYNVYAMVDGELTNGTDDIEAVADGAVTLGESEYGAISSDTSLALSTFDSQETAFSSTPAQIASRADYVVEARDFLTLKAAIDETVAAGTYNQALTLIFVGNY